MVRANYRTLEQAQNAFQRVCMNDATYPFFLLMIDARVKRIVIAYAVIAFVLVSDDQSRFVRQLIFNEGVKDFAGCESSTDRKANLAATLNRTKYDCFMS